MSTVMKKTSKVEDLILTFVWLKKFGDDNSRVGQPVNPPSSKIPAWFHLLLPTKMLSIFLRNLVINHKFPSHINPLLLHPNRINLQLSTQTNPSSSFDKIYMTIGMKFLELCKGKCRTLDPLSLFNPTRPSWRSKIGNKGEY